MDRLVKKWSEDVDARCGTASDGQEWQLYSDVISRFEEEVHITPACVRKQKYWDDWVRGVLLNRRIHRTELVRAPPSTTVPSRRPNRMNQRTEVGLFPPCVSLIIDKKKKGKILHLQEKLQTGTFLLSANQSFDTVLKYLLSGPQNESPEAITNRVNRYKDQQCKGCDTLFKEAVQKKQQTLVVDCPMTVEANKASGIRIHERILCQARFVAIHGKGKRIPGYINPQDGRSPTDWTLNLL
eukprot:scaffold15612_cov57-Cyclotella_meneghiniana.AAC.2